MQAIRTTLGAVATEHVGTFDAVTTNDEFRWLEDVEGDDAMAWVRERNERAESTLFLDPTFERIKQSTLDVLEADDRIAYPSRHGDLVHNFWTDARHRRGLLRRTTWADYRAGAPEWETILDIDALCEAETESWVFHGSSTRRPDRRRALIELSPGGSDASVTREFDLVDKRFIPPDEGGFVRPVAKGSLTWIDDDTVYVTSDFGPGSLTRSGYPRTVRRWTRSTPIEDAEIVFEGEESDVAVGVSVSAVVGFEHHVFERAPEFFTTRTSILRNGEPVEVNIPDDAEVSFFERWIFVSPRSDLERGDCSYVSGSLLVSDIDGFLAGTSVLTELFVPTATAALAGFTCTRSRVALNVMDDVRNSVSVATPPAAGGDLGEWSTAPLVGAPDVWTVSVGAANAPATGSTATSTNAWSTARSMHPAWPPTKAATRSNPFSPARSTSTARCSSAPPRSAPSS